MSQKPPVHYRGDTFELIARLEAMVNGVEITNFAGYTVQSQIRDPKGALIATCITTWVDAVAGVVRLEAGPSNNWPLTTAEINVRLISADGKKISSDSAFFRIEEPPTR